MAWLDDISGMLFGQSVNPNAPLQVASPNPADAISIRPVGQQPELRVYHPSFTESVGSTIQDLLMAGGMQAYPAGHIAHGIRDLLGFSPAGVPMAVGDYAVARQQGNPTAAMAAVLGVVPGLKQEAKVLEDPTLKALKAIQEALGPEPANTAATAKAIMQQPMPKAVQESYANAPPKTFGQQFYEKKVLGGETPIPESANLIKNGPNWVIDANSGKPIAFFHDTLHADQFIYAHKLHMGEFDKPATMPDLADIPDEFTPAARKQALMRALDEVNAKADFAKNGPKAITPADQSAIDYLIQQGANADTVKKLATGELPYVGSFKDVKTWANSIKEAAATKPVTPLNPVKEGQYNIDPVFGMNGKKFDVYAPDGKTVASFDTLAEAQKHQNLLNSPATQAPVDIYKAKVADMKPGMLVQAGENGPVGKFQGISPGGTVMVDWKDPDAANKTAEAMQMGKSPPAASPFIPKAPIYDYEKFTEDGKTSYHIFDAMTGKTVKVTDDPAEAHAFVKGKLAPGVKPPPAIVFKGPNEPQVPAHPPWLGEVLPEEQRQAARLAGNYTTPAYRGLRVTPGSDLGTVYKGDQHFSSNSPELADMYSSYLSHHPGKNPAEGTYSPGASVLPLWIDTSNYHVHDAKGAHWSAYGGNQQGINAAKAAGKPGVVVHNVWDEPNSTHTLSGPKTVYITFPEGASTIKSKFAAKFNPQSKDIAQALLGMLGGGTVALPLFPGSGGQKQ